MSASRFANGQKNHDSTFKQHHYRCNFVYIVSKVYIYTQICIYTDIIYICTNRDMYDSSVYDQNIDPSR